VTGPARLAAALVGLLPPSAAAGRRGADAVVSWAGPGVTERAIGRPRPLSDRDLVGRLKAGPAPTILWLHKITPTLARALRERPPGLVVLAGPAGAPGDALQAVDDLHVLGPDAVVRQGGGEAIACAPTAGELEGLVRALGPDGYALALAPAPAWLHHVLADPAFRDRPFVGYVDARGLSVAWARAMSTREAPTVLVPLGVPMPELAAPDEPAAEIAVAAHALERRTGPIFPSPRVLARVLAGLSTAPADRERSEASALDRAIWAQARRALPSLGAVVGMEAPSGGGDSSVATAAFLAQRALLRARQAEALAAGAKTKVPTAGDDEGRARARELLANAGLVLTDHESKVVLRGYGIEVTRQAVASSASGAVGFADRIGYPVVLKALSPDLRRRSDIGAIALELPSAAVVRRAYGAIVEAMEKHAPTARLDGVLVAEMVEPGLDVRVGAVRLPGGGFALWGQVRDATLPIEPALSLSPLSTVDARLLAHAVLSRVPVPGLRRDSDPEIEDLSDLLLRVDAIVRGFSDRLAMVRIDPVRLCPGPRGAVVLDARIVQRPHLEGR
jgi:hypothetical protein